MTNMTVTFATEYDGEGTTQFKSGMQEAAAQMDTLGERGQMAGVNMEGLFGRLERPLSALVFSGVADDLTNLGTKGQSSTMQVEHGLHAIGMAITFINPLWGALFLVAGEVFNLLEKYNHLKTSEELEKETESIIGEVTKLQDVKDALEKNGGARKDELLILQQHIDVQKEKIKHDSDEIETELKKNEQMQRAVLLGQMDQELQNSAMSRQNKIDELRERETDLLKQKSIIMDSLNQIDKKDQLTQADKDAILQKQHDLQIQDLVDKTSLAQVTKIIKDNEEVLDDTRKKILSTTDVQELDMLEKKMELAKQLIDMEKQHQQELQATADQENQSIQTMVQSVNTNLDSLVSSWASGQKSLSDASKQAAAAIVNDFTNMEAGTLEMDAMKNIFINPGLAAAEFAGALAIRAAGSALASTFGGSTTSSSASPSPSSTTPGPVSSSSGGQQNQSSLTININGGMIDKPTVAYIMQMSNELVQQNGMTVVSSQVNGAVASPGSV